MFVFFLHTTWSLCKQLSTLSFVYMHSHSQSYYRDHALDYIHMRNIIYYVPEPKNETKNIKLLLKTICSLINISTHFYFNTAEKIYLKLLNIQQQYCVKILSVGTPCHCKHESCAKMLANVEFLFLIFMKYNQLMNDN